jgi:hypothetical protein
VRGRHGGDATRAAARKVPDAIRELVVGDQRRRNDICWRMFDF